MNTLEKYNLSLNTKKIDFSVGDKIKVSNSIKEGTRSRIQIFEGTVIKIKRGDINASFTVRKISHGVGVERVFPINSPSVAKIEIVSKGKVRKAKLYYLRDLEGKAARIKQYFDVIEKEASQDVKQPSSANDTSSKIPNKLEEAVSKKENK